MAMFHHPDKRHSRRQVNYLRGELEIDPVGYVKRNLNMSSVEVDGPHSYLPRHPEYRDKSQRLVSFTFWRHERIQHPSKLVCYGFFYTGEGDLVRCFYCSIGLKDFIGTDDPLLEHVRYSGDCPFLMEYLGSRRLAELKEKVQQVAPPYIPQHKLSEPQREQARIVQKTPDPILVTSARGPPKKYRHPEYESMNVRLASFTDWPRTHVQTPQQVAEAGFFFTGIRDIVRCFACDGGLQRWDPNDVPWIEHCRHFPFCPFVKDVKGDAYIEQAKYFYQSQVEQETGGAKVATLASKSLLEEEVLRPMNKLAVDENLVESNDESRRETFQTTGIMTENFEGPEVRRVLEMGFQKSDVDATVKDIELENKKVSVDLMLDMIEKRAMKPQASLQTTLNSKEIIAEHLRLKSVLFCNRCKTKDTDALFLPCQHHRFCMDCSQQITNCPHCGKKIDHIVKTFSA